MKDIFTVVLGKLHLWLLNRYLVPDGVTVGHIFCSMEADPDEAPYEVLTDLVEMNQFITFEEAVEFAALQAIERQSSSDKIPDEDDAHQIAAQWSQSNEDYYEPLYEFVLSMYEDI